MEKKGRYTLAAHLPGFSGKRGRELGPCIMGEKGMLRGEAALCIPLPALYIKKTVPRVR